MYPFQELDFATEIFLDEMFDEGYDESEGEFEFDDEPDAIENYEYQDYEYHIDYAMEAGLFGGES